MSEPSPDAKQAAVTGQVNIERYFPKGYDPQAEPWRSILLHHKAATAKAVEDFTRNHHNPIVAKLREELAAMQRLLAEKDETATTFMNQVKDLQKQVAEDKERLDWLENNYGAICGIEQSENLTFREWISDFIFEHERVSAALTGTGEQR